MNREKLIIESFSGAICTGISVISLKLRMKQTETGKQQYTHKCKQNKYMYGHTKSKTKG